MDGIKCPYCGNPAEFLSSKEFYGKDYGSNVYACRPCDARIGTHGKGKTPLGTLANAELRRWRMNAHNLVDPLWKSRKMSRTAVYKWMSEVMNLSPEETHIGMFDIEQCKTLIEHAKQKRGII